jgi:hypothetical protein
MAHSPQKFEDDRAVRVQPRGIALQAIDDMAADYPRKLPIKPLSHSIFSTPDEPADVGRVERCFGATVPGGWIAWYSNENFPHPFNHAVYDEKQQKYFLHWRGKH